MLDLKQKPGLPRRYAPRNDGAECILFPGVIEVLLSLYLLLLANGPNKMEITIVTVT